MNAERKPQLRHVDYIDIRTGRGIRFSLWLPWHGGDYVTIDGMLAGRDKNNRTWIRPPGRKVGHKYVHSITLPPTAEADIREVIETTYGKKLFYKEPNKKPPKPRKKRVFRELDPADLGSLPWED